MDLVDIFESCIRAHEFVVLSKENHALFQLFAAETVAEFKRKLSNVDLSSF